MSILRPVIRAPSSPIARSKRLLPRSRHHHHHHGHGHGHGLGLTPSSDRHHPYARSAKSTSPSYDSHTHSGDGNSGTKRSLLSCGRSSATSYGRRRSSNANESTHSHGSTSMSSSRSQSISRNGSDNSSDEANAWRPICECPIYTARESVPVVRPSVKLRIYVSVDTRICKIWEAIFRSPAAFYPSLSLFILFLFSPVRPPGTNC